ncbi:MAG: DUF1501 domain-containing protein [Flavobacteriaceae bacterium]
MMKRRDFLHGISHAAALGAIMPSLPINWSENELLNSTSFPGKILVIIRLDGGNDGLNTVIPLDQYSNLNLVRPHVIMPENKLVQLGKNDLALHPSLEDFKILSDERRMKIIQNVGYNKPDFSHFRSMDIWQSASDHDQYLTSGWIGRYMEKNHPSYPEQYPNSQYPHPLAIELGWQSSLAFTGQYSFPSFIVNNPENFQEIINEFDNVYPNSYSGDRLKYAQLIAKQSNQYSEVVKESYLSSNNAIDFPSNHLGWQLDIVSRLIRGGLNTRVYMVQMGGFDTHDQQVNTDDTTKGSHAILLKQLNDSVTAFIKSLDETGDSDRVLTMTFSEFGRTINSNGSNGTDHGTAAPMFIFGNRIDDDVLGSNPNIPEVANWEDNLEIEFDFRQVYASILDQWMGADIETEKASLLKEFPKLPITGSAIDQDGDGILDRYDQCNDTPAGAIVDTNGCEVFSLAADTFSVVVTSASCAGMNNGSVALSAKDERYSYAFDAGDGGSGVLNTANGYSATLEGLSPGTYNICFTVDGQANYQRCYSITVGEPAPLETNAVVNTSTRTVDLSLRGAKQYKVTLNGKPMVTDKALLTLPLVAGKNTIEVRTDLECQGVYFEEVFVSEEVKVYPNPTSGPLQIYVGGTDNNVNIKVTSLSGRVAYADALEIGTRRYTTVDLSNLASGVYIVTLKSDTVNTSHKIIKD